MTPVPKMNLALRSFNRRLGIDWELLQLANATGRPQCEARLDRLIVTGSGIGEEWIRRLPGVRRTKKHFLRRQHENHFLAYGRVTVFESTTSIRQLIVLSDRKMRRLSYCKVTLIARDETGLEPGDVLSVLGFIAEPRLVLVELAFDFGFGSGVTGAYVRQHALFGKSKPRNVATICGYDSWGTRKGPKFVRSYYK